MNDYIAIWIDDYEQRGLSLTEATEFASQCEDLFCDDPSRDVLDIFNEVADAWGLTT